MSTCDILTNEEYARVLGMQMRACMQCLQPRLLGQTCDDGCGMHGSIPWYAGKRVSDIRVMHVELLERARDQHEDDVFDQWALDRAMGVRVI